MALMIDVAQRLCGDDWQKWANQLLLRRHGEAEYQRIPDQDRGDAGIEGFTISSGHAYQAYGPEEPLTTAERFKKHQTKMTTDIRKFIANRETLSRLFGAIRIKRWILLVPYFDSKDIVAHAATKSREVAAAKLPYVYPESFRVCVEDEEDFACERELLMNSGLAQVHAVAEEATPKDASTWAETNDPLVQKLRGKLVKIPTMASGGKLDAFVLEMIKHYLNGQNTLEELRQQCPNIYETVRRTISEKERYLVIQSMLREGSNRALLQKALGEISDSVKAHVRGITLGTVESLAHGCVADWLIRCPLDFLEAK
jgi:hypothetical protein